MTIVALTGTPGTGKSTISAMLRERGHDVINLTAYIKEHDLLGEYDEPRDTYNVDIDALDESFSKYWTTDDDVIIDSHLAHLLSCDMIIVLRCHPSVLGERLRARGYSDAKVKENLQAEALGVILCESTDTDTPVFEIDSSTMSAEETADEIEGIISGRGNDHFPGSVVWDEEMDTWF